MVAVKMFAEGVTKQIKDYLPPEYQDIECTVTEQQKNNGTWLTGICFHIPGENISPLVYMEPFYDEIRQGKPINEVMEKIAEQAVNSRGIQNEMAEIRMDDYASVKDHLNMILVNTKANRRVLSRMPHREMEDLSAILRVEIPMPEGKGTGSVKVTNDLMEYWGVDEEQLFNTALKNMEKNASPMLMDIENVMEEILSGTSENHNLLASPGEINRSPFETMYVLSNASRINGAAMLLSPDVMKRIGEIFPEGVYILPSSIHEVLIVPKNGKAEPAELGKMVREVNRAEVAKEEVLSDRIYEYDKERGKICQVPESIEKKKVMER